MVGGKVRIRFGLAIKGFLVAFQGKRHDMKDEQFSLAGKRYILEPDSSTLNVILRWVQFLFIGFMYCWILYLDLRDTCASCFVFFCVLSKLIWDLERILGFFWFIGMEAEDARGRAKQSLDFFCVYYPVSLTNGPRHFAQSDVLFGKAASINQNGWISDILEISSFSLLDTRIRKISADSFVQLLPTVANIEKLKGDNSQGDYNWNEEIDDEIIRKTNDHP
ncbi:hypothetical protein V6N13_043168 [Hibiscus sabdariffa]|uniref:Uncharacterized protein n=2 Tax=Hibiscus sabdariffa TaxID=183260 RepID=A0ABR1ZC66_9ROSI